ncbi:MAG: CHC2 zinc finger domain-containing protein [Lachnospiraceae bacterium]|nr:CHC2 zinc finger domain-containing protein [Lachnospiraceae bacterium]
MNVFEAVKQSVTTRQAAELYGIKVNRNGMACCPFHNDRHPSMKVDRRFHCFGCQADGSVIDFTAALFGLTVKEAAEKLAADFNVSYDRRGQPPRARPAEPVRSVRRKLSEKERFQQAERKCFRVYSDYLHLLRQWRSEYAPKPDDEEWHPLFVEALEQQTYVEYLLDTLLSGSIEERAALIIEKAKDVNALEQRIAGYNAREPTRSEMSRFRHGKGKEVNEI